MNILTSNRRAAPAAAGYNHERLERRRWFLRSLLDKIGFRTLVKIERVEGLENFPRHGPAILMINHIAFFDPIVVLGCVPRNIIPLAKSEGFRNPILYVCMKLWGVIPVRRGEVDRTALREILKVLNAGEVVLIAPEGTRGSGLQRAKEGVAYLGYQSGAPIVPIALEGTVGFPTLNPARWRQPGAVMQIGRPFRFRPTPDRPRGEQLRRMTDEAMYVLAALLPEVRRGAYADLSAATKETIEFV